MSEAETISTNIGILVNGLFVYNGNLIDLKNNHGNGYRILIKTVSNSHEHVIDLIKT